MLMRTKSPREIDEYQFTGALKRCHRQLMAYILWLLAFFGSSSLP